MTANSSYVRTDVNCFLLHVNLRDFAAFVYLSWSLFHFGISFTSVLKVEHCVTLHFECYFLFGHVDLTMYTKFFFALSSPSYQLY